jgi:hypothetical protein
VTYRLERPACGGEDVTKVVLLQHSHTLPSGEKDVKIIGLYESRTAAIAAVGRLVQNNGFREHPEIVNPLVDDITDGFFIDEYEINKDHWTEGYVTT